MSKKPVKHVARKRFGQNFLHDHSVIADIIAAIAPKAGDKLVEIGPGMGALTEDLLIANNGKLDVVELDRDLIPILRTKFFNYPDFTIHEGDAMEFPFGELADGPKSLRVVGNLPYNISTPLIFHLLSFNDLIKDMHFMLQKEVVVRLAAQPGDKLYGRLGIMAQYYCQVDNLFIVGPEAFDPAPKVDSAIVRLTPYETLPKVAKDFRTFENVVKSAFAQRRKTLRNNLKGLITAEQLESIGIDSGLRPEVLSVKQFIEISDLVYSSNKATEL